MRMINFYYLSSRNIDSTEIFVKNIKILKRVAIARYYSW